MARWRDKRREHKREYDRKWSMLHREQCILRNFKRRCLIKEGNLTKDDIKEILSSPCLKCGSVGKTTIDHIVPLSKGGTNNKDNVQPLCLKCNDSKGIKIVDYRKYVQIRRENGQNRRI